jgi:hypothetical protein
MEMSSSSTASCGDVRRAHHAMHTEAEKKKPNRGQKVFQEATGAHFDEEIDHLGGVGPTRAGAPEGSEGEGGGRVELDGIA